MMMMMIEFWNWAARNHEGYGVITDVCSTKGHVLVAPFLSGGYFFLAVVVDVDNRQFAA